MEPARVLDSTTEPIVRWGEFQHIERTRHNMLGVSRSAVNRRWRLPMLAAWGKLGAAAVGLVPCLGRLPADFGQRGPEVEVFEVAPTSMGSIETWGAGLLVATAIVSLHRIRKGQLGGLSPPLRWPYGACLRGLETVGFCAWTSVAWLRAADSYTGPH